MFSWLPQPLGFPAGPSAGPRDAPSPALLSRAASAVGGDIRVKTGAPWETALRTRSHFCCHQRGSTTDCPHIKLRQAERSRVVAVTFVCSPLTVREAGRLFPGGLAVCIFTVYVVCFLLASKSSACHRIHSLPLVAKFHRRPVQPRRPRPLLQSKPETLGGRAPRASQPAGNAGITEIQGPPAFHSERPRAPEGQTSCLVGRLVTGGMTSRVTPPRKP